MSKPGPPYLQGQERESEECQALVEALDPVSAPDHSGQDPGQEVCLGLTGAGTGAVPAGPRLQRQPRPP